MKGLKTLAVLGLGIAILVAATSSPAAKKRPAAFRHYVACGLSAKAKPAHTCKKRRKKGAFFRSNRADVFYSVCVKFPTKKNLCQPQQPAEQGKLYVNKISTNIPGKHRVTWFVKGKRVGLFNFFVPRR